MALLSYLHRMFSLPTSFILPLFFLPAASPPLDLITHQKSWKGMWLRNDPELSRSLFGQIQLLGIQGVGWRNAQLLLWRCSSQMLRHSSVRSVPGFFWGKNPKELARTLHIWWQQIRGTEDNSWPTHGVTRRQSLSYLMVSGCSLSLQTEFGFHMTLRDLGFSEMKVELGGIQEI